MLTSYTDARYVSEDYARELSHARTLPVDVERVSDDPPERIAGVAVDGQRCGAAQPRSAAADRPAAHRERPVALARRRGHGRHARGRSRARRPLRSGVDAHRDASSRRDTPVRSGRPHAAAALDRFARGSLMKHVASHLRSADEEGYERFKRRLPRDRPVDHRAARRSARGRAGRARPASGCATSWSASARAAREAVRPLLNAPELGGPAHGGLPAARVRRRRGPQGAGAAPVRLRAARAARSRPGADAERHEGSGRRSC